MNDEDDLWSAFPPEVREWFRSGAPSASNCDEEDALLQELAPWTGKNVIVVSHETQPYFDVLETRFPIGFNRIEWRGVADHFFMDVLEMASGQEVDFNTHVQRLLQVRPIVDELLVPAINAQDAPLIWFGDDYRLSLKLGLHTFLDCYVVLFTTPQHNYLVPETFDWCLTYTMEGHLYFGFAAN